MKNPCPIRSIDAEETLPIRHVVLRKGMPIESARYAHDHTSAHLGYFKDEKLLGVASLCEEDFESEKAMRLRGMAVLPKAQGKGVGKALVERAITEADARGIEILWCTARTSAQGFYEGLGFVVQGDIFEVEHHGPHVVMFRAV